MQQREWHPSSPTPHSWLLFPQQSSHISCFDLQSLALLISSRFTDLLFLKHSFPHILTSGFSNMLFHLPGVFPSRWSKSLISLLSLIYTPIVTSQRTLSVSPFLSSSLLPFLLGPLSSLIFLWHISMLYLLYVHSHCVPWLTVTNGSLPEINTLVFFN